MDARVCPAALHQHVVTIDRPCVRQGGLHDSLAVAPLPELRVADNVLQEAVPSAFTQQVGRGDEHACGGNAIAVVGDEHVDPPLQQVSRQMLSARSRGCAAALTSDASNRARRDDKSEARASRAVAPGRDAAYRPW
jgi:hypothetical protein